MATRQIESGLRGLVEDVIVLAGLVPDAREGGEDVLAVE
jgi:hypothetical protein